MRVRSFGRKKLLVTTFSICAVVLAGVGGLIYMNSGHNNSAIQEENNVKTNKVEKIDTSNIQPQKDPAQRLDDYSLSIQTNNADCDKNTSSSSSSSNGQSTNTNKTTVTCNKTEDSKSSSVNVQSNTTQSSQSPNSSTGSSGSAHNSSTQQITVNQ